MEKKDPKPINLYDWPDYIVKKYLDLSPRKAYTLELYMDGQVTASKITHPVIDKAINHCAQEGVSTIAGLMVILDEKNKYFDALNCCFKEDSALIVEQLKNIPTTERYEEVICALILNSLGDEEEKITSLERIFYDGEKPSEIIHSILDNF